jgi:hypothetical protein
LAAVVIYQQLYGDAPPAAPSRLKLRSKTISKIEMSQEEAEIIHTAARETNAKRKQP